MDMINPLKCTSLSGFYGNSRIASRSHQDLPQSPKGWQSLAQGSALGKVAKKTPKQLKGHNPFFRHPRE